MRINSNIAEIIGAHIGDGTLYKTTRGYVWELRGSTKEKEYYKIISKILLEIFNIKLKPKYRAGGTYGIQTSKKEIIDFFMFYGFKPGTKTYTVRIPRYIFEGSNKIKYSFIRGLFDTDGYLRFEKGYYPRIEFGFASKNLRNDLHKLLLELKFRNYIWNCKGYKLGLAGIKNLEKWMKFISTHNSKHFNKYIIWKKNR